MQGYFTCGQWVELTFPFLCLALAVGHSHLAVHGVHGAWYLL